MLTITDALIKMGKTKSDAFIFRKMYRYSERWPAYIKSGKIIFL